MEKTKTTKSKAKSVGSASEEADSQRSISWNEIRFRYADFRLQPNQQGLRGSK